MARFAIVSLTGCTPLDLSNLAEKRILNITQGLAISAGLAKCPEVFLIESDIPNAFASGWNEESAFIGITTGLANMLNDQELEGVIAHEISHIVHRDIMICQMAVALNTAILLLAIIIRWISMLCAVFAKDGGARIIYFLLYLFILPFTSLVSLLLCMTISKKREFAADAHAVRLCSYNEGLARALEKLSTDKLEYDEDCVVELGGKEVGCMYFYFPDESIFSTHPSVTDRIQRLRAMV